MLLHTKYMELRNGINCIEALFNNDTQKLEVDFVPCNFQDEQKWIFQKRTGTEMVSGMLVNVATRKCLVFQTPGRDVNVHIARADKYSKKELSRKKNKVLEYLAKVVKESVEEVQTPYMFDCATSSDSHTFRSQTWLLGNF